MTSPDNPWFARAIVNRIVKHYLGRGLVEPVDDFRVTNPPSNEALLDALAKDVRVRTHRKGLGLTAQRVVAVPKSGGELEQSQHYHLLPDPFRFLGGLGSER